MNDYDPAESQIGAYALGALDLEDRPAVETLLSQSPEHREELRQWREVIALLPYAASPATPSEQVRERLLARIAAAQGRPAAASAVAATSDATLRPRQRWLMPGLLAGLAVLILAFATMTVSLGAAVARLDRTNRQLVANLESLQQSLVETQARQEQLAAELSAGQQWIDAVTSQLAIGEERIAQLSAELARDDYLISFVSAPGVATRQLRSAQSDLAAQGEMYMYPGHANAVVLFSGLPPLAAGQVYQFWLADGTSQVAGSTFVVDPTGIGYIIIEAPREVNAFSEVMVTVEPSGGSPIPSQNVVLEGSL